MVKNKSGNLFYQCTCECGKVLIVQYSSITSGVTTSCGCAHADIMREKLTTHGLRHHPLYRVWENMIDRCRNPNNTHYDIYMVEKVFKFAMNGIHQIQMDFKTSMIGQLLMGGNYLKAKRN